MNELIFGCPPQVCNVTPLSTPKRFQRLITANRITEYAKCVGENSIMRIGIICNQPVYV